MGEGAIETVANDVEANDIAIIGMACRLPGANDAEEYWRQIQRGEELLTVLDREQLRRAGVAESLLDDPSFIPVTSVIDGYGDFEPGFFGITPSEARLIDPQHRLFLELCWHCLEDAGYDPARYPGDIGVFAGGGRHAYLRFVEPHFEDRDYLDGSIYGLQADTGNYGDFLATRVSYKLGLRGPSLDVQTACSTALVSVHLACQSLLLGEADLALAGGVNLHTPQIGGYVYEEGSICSPDGHLRPFDAKANGSVFGNGGGVVALKRLDDAVRAGDRIVAVVKGSALNNDGSAKMSFTAPSVEGQAEVVRRARRIAGVRPEEIGYIETHGTGTALGDPIEIAALVSAFDLAPGDPFCALGTVKSQIGHLGPAAGIAGLIKAALVVERGEIPTCVNFDTLNPEIKLSGTPFFVPKQSRPWAGPRYAGVSAFGVGGTNAHVILAQPPTDPGDVAEPPPRPVPLVLSARTVPALDASRKALRRHLSDNPHLQLGDVANVLATGRHQHRHRAAVTADTVAGAVAALDAEFASAQPVVDGELPVVFAFPGQGSQYVDAGRALYASDPTYRNTLDECSEILAETVGLDIRQVLMPGPDGLARASALLHQALWAQPAIFATQYALARSLLAAGIRPEAMIGHSVGEYAAACLAGVFSVRDALAMVSARGRLMHHGTAPGAMMAVNLPPDRLEQILPPGLDIAAVNAPDQTVVAGPVEVIAQFDDQLAGTDILHTVLGTSLAAHSSMMDPIVDEFRAVVETVRFAEPDMAIASTMTGQWVRDGLMSRPDYWVRHLRQPVQFATGAGLVLARGPAVVVEVGTGRALAGMFRQADGGAHVQAVTPWVRKEPEPGTAADVVGAVWSRGGTVDWSVALAGLVRRRVALPGYPFERAAYWMPPPAKPHAAAPHLPVLGSTPSRQESWLTRIRWEVAPLPDGAGTAARRRILALVPRAAGPVEQSLTAAGHDVVAVAHAAIDAEQAGRLVDRMEDGDEPIDAVLYVAADHGDAAPDLRDRVDRVVAEGFWPLLTVVAEVARRRRRRPVDVVVVTAGRHRLDADPSLRPELALLAGPCRVLPQEYPNVRVLEIDLESLADPTVVGDHVAAEFDRAGEQTEVAYRGNVRHVARYSRLPDNPTARPTWSSGGRYLVTGGLGGIGLAMAEEAAAVPGVRLVLTHRTPLPDDEEAARLLADPATPGSIRRRLTVLERLKEAGAQVTCVVADVTDPEALSRVRREHGPFTGIVHAAGVPGGRLIERLDPAHAQAVLAPKVNGALLLDAVVADGHTEWTAYCSSVSSVVGGLGHADYCSANAFLDAFAQYRRAAGRPTTSLGYDAWTQFGMAVDEAERSIEARTRAFDHPVLTDRRDRAGATEYSGRLRHGAHWVIDEHTVAGRAVLPGTAIIDLLATAGRDRLGSGPVRIDGLDLASPLTVPPGTAVEIQVRLAGVDGPGAETPGHLTATLSSRAAGGGWVTHASCELRALPDGDPTLDTLPAPSGAWSATTPSSELVSLGPRWSNIRSADRAGEDELIVECVLPAAFAPDADQFLAHPALLDTATGALLSLLTDQTYLPMSYESVTVHRPMPPRVRSRIIRTFGPDGRTVRFDVAVRDAKGVPVVDVVGYTLRRAVREMLDDHGGNRALVSAQPGDLSSIGMVPVERSAPGPGEVEIKVMATGLNFKEVLIGADLLATAGTDHRYGLECAGTVSAVGAGVTDFAPGDPVMAIGMSCFSDYAVVPAALTCRIPAGMTFAQAASIPVAFTTAYDCLANVAGLRAGERVLVHAVTGGVGLAAVQIARILGAEVFGTAGTPAKRDFAATVGVARVMNSRTVDFAQETVDAGGVDVVLNSLAGDFIPAGLRTLRRGGRFVEIGRRDILAGAALDLSLFAESRTFTSYSPDLASAGFVAAFARVAELVADDRVTPLPVRVFPLDDAAAAFEHMSRAHHIGKVVVGRPGADTSSAEANRLGRSHLVADQQVEGITASVGVAALHQALAHGAGHVLVTRRTLGAVADEMVVADHVLVDPEQAGRSSRPELAYGYVPPEGDTEQRLGAVWAAVLSIEQVGREDRFLDLGGDSLYATQVVTRIRKEFGVRIAPANILGDVPLRAVAELVDELLPRERAG
jgi:acyl transferase domain-containing protein/acyl carrier protein